MTKPISGNRLEDLSRIEGLQDTAPSGHQKLNSILVRFTVWENGKTRISAFPANIMGTPVSEVCWVLFPGNVNMLVYIEKAELILSNLHEWTSVEGIKQALKRAEFVPPAIEHGSSAETRIAAYRAAIGDVLNRHA